jgi:hypothetical protein
MARLWLDTVNSHLLPKLEDRPLSAVYDCSLSRYHPYLEVVCVNVICWALGRTAFDWKFSHRNAYVALNVLVSDYRVDDGSSIPGRGKEFFV